MSGFEWDDEKNATNRAKHGISFEEAVTIWEGPVVTGHDERHHPEAREVSVGLVGITVVCVVHTDRNEKIRIISARKATRSETREFDAYLQRTRH